MKDADFRRQLEEDADRTQPGQLADLAGAFDGLAERRIPFVRAHMAFAALDAYLMLAVDIYGRKGTVFKLERRHTDLVLSRGSQTASCTHYLDQAAIGFKYTGLQSDASLTPLAEGGFPSTAEAWKPTGAGLLLAADRADIQKKVQDIVSFLRAAG